MTRIKDGQGNYELHQAARSNNEEANQLAKMAVTGEKHLTQSFQFEVLHTPATDEQESLLIEEGESWMTLVYRFLTED